MYHIPKGFSFRLHLHGVKISAKTIFINTVKP